jgi:hypothetical protein
VLTLFSVPKPFVGVMETIQLNALRSWRSLPDAQIVLVGDEPGTAETASRLGVEHVAGIATNDHGTPLLNEVFAAVDEVGMHAQQCYVNADIILLPDDFVPAVRAASAANEPFLMIGRTVDLPVDEELDSGDAAVRTALRARAASEGVSRGPTAIDYFVYTRGIFDPVPPFAVGRAGFDNWLVWRARTRGRVLDASRAVLAVHQHHDYAHVGSQDEAHFGAEANTNRELAGGSRHLYTIHDASHTLTAGLKSRRNLGSVLRIRETVRKAAWKTRRAL